MFDATSTTLLMRLGCCRCAHTDNGNPARRVCDDVWERNEKLPSGQLICHFLLRMQVSDETRNLQKARRCSLTLRACGGGVRWWRRRGSSVTCTDTSSFWLQCWQDLQEAVQEICEWYLESTERQVWARCVWRASPVWQQIHHNPPPGHWCDREPPGRWFPLFWRRKTLSSTAHLHTSREVPQLICYRHLGKLLVKAHATTSGVVIPTSYFLTEEGNYQRNVPVITLVYMFILQLFVNV